MRTALILVGLGTLAMMELEASPRAKKPGPEPLAQTTVGPAVSRDTLTAADRFEIVHVPHEATVQPISPSSRRMKRRFNRFPPSRRCRRIEPSPSHKNRRKPLSNGKPLSYASATHTPLSCCRDLGRYRELPNRIPVAPGQSSRPRPRRYPELPNRIPVAPSQSSRPRPVGRALSMACSSMVCSKP